MQKSILLVALSVLGTTQISAQNNDSLEIRMLANEVLTNSTSYENLRFLTKNIGHRLSGSTGAEKAVQVTAKMLKEAGADTVYLQPCMVPKWVRGAKESGYVTFGSQKRNLKLLALGNSEGSGPKGVTADVVVVNTLKEVDEKGNALKGKIVLYNVPMSPLNVRTFMSYGESVGARGQGASLAAKYGALAVLVRSMASNPDDHPHTGAMRYDEKYPKIPAVAISTNDAIWIAEKAKQGTVKAHIVSNAKMLGDVLSYNVIGEMLGAVKPKEIITVGGHLDSWDIGEGAHDDATGCVQSIEVLRAFKATGRKPNRTIRAVMFMNEENGLKGGQAYLDSAISKKEDHLFALESDAGGFTPRGFGFSTPDTFALNRLLSWAPLFKEYQADEFFAGGGGADIGPLRKINTVLAGYSPDSQRYFDVHHAETDVFEAVSRRELELGAAVMTGLIYLVDKYGLRP